MILLLYNYSLYNYIIIFFLKLLSEIIKGNLFLLLSYKVILSLYNRYLGLFSISSIAIIIYYIYLYNFISFWFLLRLTLIFWWIGRLITTCLSVKGELLPFANRVNFFSFVYVRNFEGRIIGLNYYILPYGNLSKHKKAIVVSSMKRIFPEVMAELAEYNSLHNSFLTLSEQEMMNNG